MAQSLQGMRDLSDPVSISDIPGAGHREAGGFPGFVCSFTFSFYLPGGGGILFLMNNFKLFLQSWSAIYDAKLDCRGLGSKISYPCSLR